MIIDVNAHYGSDPSMPATYSEAELMALLKIAGIDRAITTDLSRTLTPFPHGVRLYPTYEPLDFDGLQWSTLLLQARDKKIVLQVVLRLQDPRVLPQLVSSVDVIGELKGAVEANRDIRFLVSGATLAEANANKDLFTRDNVWMDISSLQHPTNSLNKLIDAIGSHHILFGSNAPIFYPYANVFRVMNSEISDDDRERILWRNAAELLGEADFSLRSK